MAYWREFSRDARPRFIAAVALINLAIVTVRPYTGWDWLFVPIGIVFFYFAEYITHRFILHGILKIVMPRAYVGHEQHHVEPSDIKYLLTPNIYNLPSYIGVWGVALLVTRHFNLTSAFLIGASLSQLYYEWVHFVSHRPIVPKTAWGKWMKKYHLLHHYKNEHFWFGVTNPSLDVVFQTDPDKTAVPTHSISRP